LGLTPSKVTVAAKSKSPFLGVWRIVEMEQWARDYIDLEGPGFIKFERSGGGTLRFGAVEADLDCKAEERKGQVRIEFSFEGRNDADPCFGRGWAEIRNEELDGELFIHHGDRSWFKAVRP
jgi:hypothetical protein